MLTVKGFFSVMTVSIQKIGRQPCKQGENKIEKSKAGKGKGRLDG